MSQVPRILVRKLAQLGRRERLLRLVWGCARVAGLAIVVFLAACLFDWLIDLWDETPWEWRTWISIGQLVFIGFTVLLFVFLPQLWPLWKEKLALLVESKRPELQHRLISALQLNRRGARTEGMSPELLAAMTREAEDQAAPMNFAAVADHSRLKRSALVLIPLALVVLGLFLFDPDTAWALAQRQLLYDVDIPRAVSVAANADAIWPSGEEGVLRFAVTGPGVTSDQGGTVRIRDDDDRSFRVPLAFEAATGDDSAIYVAKVPPGTSDFSYTAKVSDGRTRSPSRVRYVARPSVIKQDAYVILPTYLEVRPDGTRYLPEGKHYEQAQLRGDIVGMPGLSVRVVVETQKPIVRAVLEIDGSPYPDLSGTSGLTRMHDSKARMLASLTAATSPRGPLGPLLGLCAAETGLTKVMLRHFEHKSISPPTNHVEWQFDLRATETRYRVMVFDEYGFASKTETVRAIKVDPEPPPTVVLQPERWEPAAAFASNSKASVLLDFEGMPLPIVDDGKPGPLRISYQAVGPYGIGRAQLKVDVFRGGNNSEAPVLMRSVTLPLAEEPSSKRAFDESKGAFADSPDSENVFFYALPTRSAEMWPRTKVGGRLDYQPAGILDEDGMPFAFKPDDRIVVYLEVFNRNPDPKLALMGKSRLREKELVPWEKFERWCYDTLQEASRIETLMYMQQRVYDRPWLSIFGFKGEPRP